MFLSIDIIFFFFKQKTAYELRISDWSSDVCSSDLPASAPRATRPAPAPRRRRTTRRPARDRRASSRPARRRPRNPATAADTAPMPAGARAPPAPRRASARPAPAFRSYRSPRSSPPRPSEIRRFPPPPPPPPPPHHDAARETQPQQQIRRPCQRAPAPQQRLGELLPDPHQRSGHIGHPDAHLAVAQKYAVFRAHRRGEQQQRHIRIGEMRRTRRDRQAPGDRDHHHRLAPAFEPCREDRGAHQDRKSTRLNSSH